MSFMNHNALIGIITHLYTRPKPSNFLQNRFRKNKCSVLAFLIRLFCNSPDLITHHFHLKC
ncbi:hypothetical protein E0H79_01700 [Acinetobacter sp. ANC 5045]|nr:hypothetical protein E0H79_01700 [Acinetobacter sp. ANC 5045]